MMEAMTFSRRKILLFIWALSILAAGLLVTQASGDARYGAAASLSLLAISLGVPLMRALTEFSK
jgi:hypothetical protein